MNPARAILLALLCTALAPVPVALAQNIYTCRDASGRVLTSDRMIPECENRDVRVLSRSGILIREIRAPLTPEQQRVKDIEDRKRREQEEAAREARRRDRALLSTYTSIDAIEASRQRALSEANETITSAKERLAALAKEQAANRKEAARYTNTKTRVPYVLQHKIDDVEYAMGIDRKLIATRMAEIGRINQRYDADKRRFIELSSTAPPVPARAAPTGANAATATTP